MKGPPALLGGDPASDPELWPRWPQWDDCERSALNEVLESGRWQSGPRVATFEEEFARYCSVEHAVTVTNGTTSLELALRALGVGANDEVIIPSYTFAATALAVMTVGAVPVLVDSHPETLALDPAGVRAALTERTRAIMPVHVGGHPVDLDALAQLADENGIAMVEDAAHGHGAEWRGRRIGGHCAIASFSFQTGKSITSGDGGCLTTDSAELAAELRSLRAFGRSPRGEFERVGGNARMTEFQAAILSCQLQRLDGQIALRSSRVETLSRALEGLPGIRLAELDGRVTRHPYYQVVLRYDAGSFGLPKRLLLRALEAEGLVLEGGYEPLHRLPFFRQATTGGRVRALPCPVAEDAADDSVLWMSFRMALGDPERFEELVAGLWRLHEHAPALLARWRETRRG